MSAIAGGSFAVKAEPQDIFLSEPPPNREQPDEASPSKRRRLEVMVVVPTLEEVNQKRRTAKLEESDVKLEKSDAKLEEADVKLPWIAVKGKIKKGPKALPNFDLNTIDRRLEVLGPAGERDFAVNIPNEIKFTAVPRQFFSCIWGGNPQETFPIIGAKFLEKHGLNDFMYPNLLWNPHGPQIPGCAGLFFEPNGLDSPGEDSPYVHRVIVRLPEGPTWLYVGNYQQISSPALTKDEWLMQAQKVRNTWAREILRKGWGSHVRARVGLRKQLGRNPTKQEFEAALVEPIPITQDDIRRAYDLGEECLGVYVLKCVAYDEAFQREVFEGIQTWVPPAKKEKGAGKDKKPKTHKRKRVEAPVEEVVSESDHGEDVFEDDDEEEIADELKYVSRGTKSRPLK